MYNGAYLTEKAVLSNKRNDFQAPEGMMLTLMGKHKQDDSQFLRCFNRLHTSLKSNITMRLQASPTRKPEQLSKYIRNCKQPQKMMFKPDIQDCAFLLDQSRELYIFSLIPEPDLAPDQQG